MSCPEILRTQAWLDGELDKTAAAEAEHHANCCAQCSAFVADAAAISDTMRTDAVRWPAPLHLRGRIVSAIERQSRLSRVSFRSAHFWYGAAGGAGLSALAAALALFLLLPVSSSSLVNAVTDAHTRALMSHQTVAVRSGNHHTVKPWFADRVDVSPPVVDLGAQGFALVGGRVDRIAGAPAAVVVYRHGGHEIDLFVWADRKSALPREAVHHGYRTMFWKNRDLDFAAVSDVDRDELEKFVQLVRSEKP
jgi:anti-sigma factor RsiW